MMQLHAWIDILFFHCSFVDMLNIISTCRDILCVDINVDKRCVDHSTNYNVLSLSLLYLSLSSSLFLPFFFSIFLSSLFLSLSLTFLIFSRSFPFPFFPFREEILWTKFSNLGACQLKFVAVGVKISKFFSKGVLSNNFSALFHEMGPLQTTGESYVKMGLQVFTSPCPMF